MDYSVLDSSVKPSARATASMAYKDCAIRIGIVREEREAADGTTRYITEVYVDGKQIPVSCVMMTRFGGVNNYEEYRISPWSKDKSDELSPDTAGKYEFRLGDAVLVAFLNGNAKEGVILGGFRHPKRKTEATSRGELAYVWNFNGVRTQINSDGSYRVSSSGGLKSVDGVVLPDPPPSFFEFDAGGAYTCSTGKSSSIKIAKNGGIALTAGGSTVTIGAVDSPGGFAEGEIMLKTERVMVNTSISARIKAGGGISMQAVSGSFKFGQIAIGSDKFELITGLGEILDAIGELVITSPVGTCTPVNTAPQWAAKIIPLKLKLESLKFSLEEIS